MMATNMLTAEQVRLQGVSRELAQDFAVRADQHDRERSAPVENFKKLREAGLFGLVIPREYGGLGGQSVEYGLVAGELAQGCTSTTMAFSMHICATGVMFRGAPIAPEKLEIVADLVIGQGKLLCASASETGGTGHALHTLVPQGVAKPVEDGFEIAARKAFCSNFEASDYCLLFLHPQDAETADTSIAVLVNTKEEGIEVKDVWDTVGMRATRSNEVIYKDVPVPQSRVIAREQGLFLATLGRSGAYFHHVFTQTYLGLGFGILEWAKAYLSGRTPRGFAQSMAHHPSVRRRIGDLAALLEAARASAYLASAIHDKDGPTPQAIAMMVKAKLATSRALAECVTSVPVACGANSLFTKLPLGRMLRDAMTASVMPPNVDVAMDMVGMGEMGLDPSGLMPPMRLAD